MIRFAPFCSSACAIHPLTRLIANVGVYSGIGVLDGGRIVVDWGQKYPVIYQVSPNGVLSGTWNNGTATETLVPD